MTKKYISMTGGYTSMTKKYILITGQKSSKNVKVEFGIRVLGVTRL